MSKFLCNDCFNGGEEYGVNMVGLSKCEGCGKWVNCTEEPFHVVPNTTKVVEKLFPAMPDKLPMSFAEYQARAKSTAIYPLEYSIVYPTLGLCGESGEVAEKIKKWIRDGGGSVLPEEKLELLKKELGDVLWYIANLADDLGLSMQEIAELNIAKLADRANRGVLHGSGDNR